MQIGIVELGEMVVGEGRVEILAASRDAPPHRPHKGGLRPMPDAGAGGGGDVAAVDRSERGLDRNAAGIIGAVAGGVAGAAIAQRRQFRSLLDQGRVKRCRRGHLDAIDQGLLRIPDKAAEPGGA